MMQHHVTRMAAGLLLTGALLAPTAAGAQESSDNDPTTDLPDSVDGAQRFCTRAINNRLVVLEILERAVNRVDAVTDGHEASLDELNAATRTSLQALREDIQATEDYDTVEALCQDIVTEHYVYRLVSPQHRLTITGDRLVRRVDNLRADADDLQAEIDAADPAVVDVVAAQAALDAMRGALDTAATEASSIGDNVIALTPADVNAAGSADEVLSPIRTDRRDARVAIRDAREDKREIRSILDAG
jgi:hypothetical protein